jgi:hypothetical protein
MQSLQTNLAKLPGLQPRNEATPQGYLGNYDTLSTAESVVSSIWFKYLPNLN